MRHEMYRRMVAVGTALTAREAQAVRTHMAGCPECTALSDSYARQDRFLQALRTEPLPAGTLEAVLHRVSDRRVQRGVSVGALFARGPLISVAALALILLVLSSVVYAAGTVIRVYLPESGSPPRSAFFGVVVLPPYATVHYRAIDPATAARQSGYPLAYLRNPPPTLAKSVGVDILSGSGPTPPPPAQPPAYRGFVISVPSVVRYRGGGHTVIVLLNRPSQRIIRTRELELGQVTVHLPNGERAWASTDVSQSAPFVQPHSGAVNELSWVRGDNIVTLFSDLPQSRLKQLAADTTVSAGKPLAQRSIPASWPAPQPLDRLPSRLNVVACGVVAYARHASALHVGYWASMDTYSQGALWGLDKWSNVSVDVLFAPALRIRNRAVLPHEHFAGGSFGFGGTVVLRMAGMTSQQVTRALKSGVTLRVRWTEKGHHRGTTVHLPMIRAESCNMQDPTCRQVRFFLSHSP
jgi:hypothetical protein